MLERTECLCRTSMPFAGVIVDVFATSMPPAVECQLFTHLTKMPSCVESGDR